MNQGNAQEDQRSIFERCVEEVLDQRRELLARLANSEKGSPMPFALPDAVANRVRSLMSSGGFADETAVVSAAFDLLERRQRFREMVQEGIDAADRGDVVDHETVFREARQRIAEIAAEQAQKVAAK